MNVVAVDSITQQRDIFMNGYWGGCRDDDIAVNPGVGWCCCFGEVGNRKEILGRLCFELQQVSLQTLVVLS